MVRGKHLFFLGSLSLVVLFTGLLIPTTTFARTTQSTVQQIPQLGTYNLPSWWKGTTCDQADYASAYLITTWRGIQVCGPFPGLNSTGNAEYIPGASQYEFQCTELVARYMYLAYGFLSPIANGSQIVDVYTAAHPTFHKIINDGTIHMAPVEGDVLSYTATASNGFFGHTSIVTSSSVNASGYGTISIIQQNITWNGAPHPIDQLTVSNWVIQPSIYGAGSVSDWMTPRAVTYPPTTVNFSVTMPGIGNTSGNNNSPHHPQRTASVQILNTNGSVVNTVSTIVTYSSSSGTYSGSVTLSLPAGSYMVSVKLSNSLSKQLPGFFTAPTATWNPGSVALVSGDINDDNVLDILDYNDLLSCYGNKFSTCQFNPGADLNDDGIVDGADYNIWLRDMQTQSGG